MIQQIIKLKMNDLRLIRHPGWGRHFDLHLGSLKKIRHNERDSGYPKGTSFAETVQVEDTRQSARITTGSSGNDKFKNALLQSDDIFLIGELKFTSPSAGVLSSSKELLERAKGYDDAGVDAISIITEKHFFNGDTTFVSSVKQKTSLPILQKDFVIDERQIIEAKELGSDALLLMARIVDEVTLQEFVDLCIDLKIEPVVEIYNVRDLQKALKTKTRIIAVNARDLDTFEINLMNARKLLQRIPNSYIKLGFSGVRGKKEVDFYRNAGAKGVLVGTSLMKARDIRDFIKMLRLKICKI